MNSSNGVPIENTRLKPIEGPGNRPSDAPPDSLVGTAAGGTEPSTTTDPGMAGAMAGAGTGTSGGLDRSGEVDTSGRTSLGSGSGPVGGERAAAPGGPPGGRGQVPDARRLGATPAATRGSSGAGSGAGQEADLTSDVGGA